MVYANEFEIEAPIASAAGIPGSLESAAARTDPIRTIVAASGEVRLQSVQRAAVDVPTGSLYVTSNRWVSRITVIANDEKKRDPAHPSSAGEKHYRAYCAACPGPSRAVVGMVPPLVGLKFRMTDRGRRRCVRSSSAPAATFTRSCGG